MQCKNKKTQIETHKSCVKVFAFAHLLKIIIMTTLSELYKKKRKEKKGLLVLPLLKQQFKKAKIVLLPLY